MAKCPRCLKNNDYPADGLCLPCYKKIQGEKKIAEKWILEYRERLSDNLQAEAEFSELSATAGDGQPHGSGISNPTLNKAQSLLDVRHREKWLMAVSDMERYLKPRQREFLGYWRDVYPDVLAHKDAGPAPWAQMVEIKYALAGKDVPARGSIWGWRKDIVTEVIRYAVQYGCLR